MKTTTEAGREAGDAALGTRERIVRAASRLMQRQGYEGTGIKQISREAGATLGSVYHFFPGGKQELATEAIRHGDQEFTDILREALDGADDPAEAIAACARTVAEALRASDWIDGCPVTATSIGTAESAPDLQRAAAEAFARWRGLVEDELRASGFAEESARELAHTVISTLEGAELAAQLARDEAPLLIAGRHLARLIDSYR
ncbi:TetR/AcrR family transcriptional regulator [Streptomyces eurocidicus]|uniref:AcrR family transcriptional regulator n=2 Tax=Streptomyces eurocidicus TaxID=66423 RepID=A0A7W8B7U6_STREU|nr:TetR/AcrR family transcriptional regulator [Streptomyces eurocidicus]MBB5116788.1 AcrR family transcriptional regulator [Streptomyces eurocidicus]MBF6052211.1 TetR family transcriptional regulator [Streptomyces eurocidicus]